MSSELEQPQEHPGAKEHFRSYYGNDLDRLDFSTPTEVRSLYHVWVTGEDEHRIYVKGVEVVGDGGLIVSYSIPKLAVTQVIREVTR